MFHKRYALGPADETDLRARLQRVPFVTGHRFVDPVLAHIVGTDTTDAAGHSPVCAGNCSTHPVLGLVPGARQLFTRDEVYDLSIADEELWKRAGVDIGLAEALLYVESGKLTVSQARAHMAMHDAWTHMPLLCGIEAHAAYNAAVYAKSPVPRPDGWQQYYIRQTEFRHLFELAWARRLASPHVTAVSRYLATYVPFDNLWSAFADEAVAHYSFMCSLNRGVAPAHLASACTNPLVFPTLSASTNLPLVFPAMSKRRVVKTSTPTPRRASLGAKARLPLTFERPEPVARPAHRRPKKVAASLIEKAVRAEVKNKPSDALLRQRPALDRLAKALSKAEGVPTAPHKDAYTFGKQLRDVLEGKRARPQDAPPPPRPTLRAVVDAKKDSKAVSAKSDEKREGNIAPTSMGVGGIPHAMTTLGNKVIAHGAKVTHLPEGAVRVRHREYAFDITGTATFSPRQEAINPGNTRLFPWLGFFALNYDQYYINSLSVHLNTVEAASVKGRLAAAFDYDNTDDLVSTKAAFLQIRGASEATAWQNVHCKLDVKSAFPTSRKYIRTVAVPGQDINFYDAAKFVYMTDLCADTTVNAEVWVEYDISFFNPNLENGLGSSSYAAGLSGTASSANPTIVEPRTGMFGTNPSSSIAIGSSQALVPRYSPFAFTYGGVSFAAGNYWRFPAMSTGVASYLINYTYVGTGLNTSMSAFTVYNAAVHSMSTSDSKTASWFVGNGNAAANAGTIVTGWARYDIATASVINDTIIQIADTTATTCSLGYWQITSIPQALLKREIYGDPEWLKPPPVSTPPVGKTEKDSKDTKDDLSRPSLQRRPHITVEVDDDASGGMVVVGAPSELRSATTTGVMGSMLSALVDGRRNDPPRKRP
jgi:hypothetical protein